MKFDKKTAKRCLLVIAVVTTTALLTHALWPTEAPVNVRIKEMQAGKDQSEPPPNIKKGTPTWRAVRDYYLADIRSQATTLVPDGYAAFNEHVTGLCLEDLNNLVRDYEDKGIVLAKEYPAGTVVTNSGYDWGQRQFELYRGFTFKKPRVLLVLPDGYVPVKLRRSASLGPAIALADEMAGQPAEGPTCGNGMRVISVPKGQKPKPVTPEKPKKPCPPQKPPRNKFPWTTPHDPGNPSTQPPKDNTDKAGPTPGVEPGEPEETKGNQDDNVDVPGPVDDGRTGFGDNGDTQGPGGTEEAPSHPVDPSPPPENPNHEGELPIVD